MQIHQALAVVVVAVFAQAPAALANREPEPFPVNVDAQSLASPDYDGYRPAWANPYADPSGFGVNDYPTPFYPADEDQGPSPLESDGY